MFIRLFRSDYSWQIVIIVALSVFLWVGGFVHPVPMPAPGFNAPFYQWIYLRLYDIPWLATLLGLLLVLGEAILLNLLITTNDLAPRNTAMPALLYLILMSWTPELLTLHPVVLANGCMLFFLYMFLQVYELPDAFKEVYSASFTIAVAALFYLPAAFFFLLIWIGFIIYRTFTWREWIISMTGFLGPVFFIAVYYFWNDTLLHHILIYKTWFSHPAIPHLKLKWPEITFWLVFGLLNLAAVFRILSIIQEKVISIRKNFMVIIWYFLTSLPALFYAGNDFKYFISVIFMSSTILLAYYFSVIKRLFIVEVLFAILLGMIAWIRIF